MCLAIPTRIIDIDQNEMLTIESGGVRKKISASLIENARVGEWVIVHAGFAIQKLDEKEAQETIRLLREIADEPSIVGFEKPGDPDQS
ncbi:MAG: HypC/HybG/HupF family hydrogenase formation chaperone [Deltaproteobacteria bacterium]|nr:HypC/HybG/HupF family hydrogenase formation chaperone [Deltaproteobacteria bacterium]MBW2053489.1 HypC/HybG/HupF family hydrogenase formation chaperone [Deltaproteobacteria bacterium]MBW2140866.1 HypC/HybG/HupF family hydrogenase formation chaperone [Deltaproteobacteria bacterium]MBW2323104.1 HypC/HybG/HupF family hydrogenase formation chaperone [Deltaproteobacteria bacterium]